MPKYASEMLKVMQSWVGKNEADGSHKEIIDIYNSYKPHPRNKPMEYSYPWCAATPSAAAIKLGYTDICPIEMSCKELIRLAKEMGIWIEDDSIVPTVGMWMLFDFDEKSKKGDNKGDPEHIGFVEKANSKKFTLIEGNKNNAVERRDVDVDGIYIRGFIAPRYDAEPVEEKVKMKVIDVSSWQKKIDWEKVKPQIDGAILRCGYGSDWENQDDKYFKRNADECTRLGIPFGVYIYSYAKTVEDIHSEASHVLRLIDGYKLAFPVYLDLEHNGTEAGAVKRAEVFGDLIEKAGYWCGIYANLNWWRNYLSGLERFTKWVAQYNKTCTYEGSYDIWQYTSEGKIDGIEGNVDMNWCYRDFPKLILKEDSSTPTTKPEAPAAPEKEEEKEKAPKYTNAGDITYQAYTGGKWLPKVKNYNHKNSDGYAGIKGKDIQGLKINAKNCDIYYRVHTVGGKWLPEVKNSGSGNDGYAGIYGKDIDCVQIRVPKGKIKYRVHTRGGRWWDWVTTDNAYGNTKLGNFYAGIYGKPIDMIQIDAID